MSILSTNKKLISIGAEYSAGQGIDITNHIISVVESAVGTNYSAGPNIDIYDDEGQPTISSKDWSSEIADASANAYEQAIAQIPEPQDLSYLSGRIDTNTSGIDYISSVCITAHQDWTDTIKGASSYSYKQSTSYFDNWISGQYTGDITNITNKVTAISGNFDNYYKKTETSSKDEINDALQYVSANAGKVYEGVSPIVVNNTEDKISADTWTFSAGSNVSFVDDNVNKITRIDCTVTGEGGDPQVNSFVYDNSAKINDVNSSYQTNSGTFLTAIPSQYATTGDVAELAQTISETYYPNTNPSSFVNEDWVNAQGYITGVDLSEYAKRDFVLSSVESATSGKLDVSSFASVSSDFLTNEDLNGYATESFVENVSGDITALIPTDYATTTQINELSGAVDYVSANAGDQEVNTLVHTNSSTWNDVSETVQTNSSTWSTEVPTGDFALKSDFTFRDLDYDRHYLTGVSGYLISATRAERCDVATIAQRDTNGNYIAHTYYTSAAANTLSSMLSGAVDYVSGQVDNKLDTTAFSDVSGTFLTGIDLSNYYTKSETSGASEIADALANIPTGNPEVENYVQTNSGTIDDTVTSYQTNSGTFLTAHQAISANEWNDCYDNVNTNSGAWGGSALPISAGNGIKLQMINGILVAFIDETVLWEGSHSVSVESAFSLSESPANFEFVEIYGEGYPGHQRQLISKWYTNEMTTDYLNCMVPAAGANGTALRMNQFLISGNSSNVIWVGSARQFSLQGTAASTASSPSKITKIIGINHK